MKEIHYELIKMAIEKHGPNIELCHLKLIDNYQVFKGNLCLYFNTPDHSTRMVKKEYDENSDTSTQ